MSPLPSVLFPHKSSSDKELAQPLSLSKNKNYRLKKSGIFSFIINMKQLSAALKALLGKF